MILFTVRHSDSHSYVGSGVESSSGGSIISNTVDLIADLL